MEQEYPSSKASFASLPYELRQIIWTETFEPQTLTIEAHFNKAYTKRRRTNRISTWGNYCTYTAKLGVHPNRAIRKRGTKGYVPVLSPEAKALLPPAPAALHVCRDSRAIAMRDYRLAFRGSTNCLRDQKFMKEWIEGGHNQGRIWVDYKRDSIFFCDLSDKGFDHKNMFFGFPDEEAVRVKTLATCYVSSLTYAPQEMCRFWSLGTFQMYYGNRSQEICSYAEQGRERLVQALKKSRLPRSPVMTPLPNVELVQWTGEDYI